MWKIINPYRMAIAVRDNQVSQKEFWAYVIIFMATLIISIISSIPFHVENILIGYVLQILSFFTFLMPLIIAYFVNKKADNRHFLYRYMSINIPISIIVALLNLVLSFIYVGFLHYLKIQRKPEFGLLTWHDVALYFISAIILNIMIYKYMRIASGGKKLTKSDSNVVKTHNS